MSRRTIGIAGTLALLAGVVPGAAAASGHGMFLPGPAGEFWPSGHMNTLTAHFTDLEAGTELRIFFGDPGDAVVVRVDPDTLPGECTLPEVPVGDPPPEGSDEVLCIVGGTDSVSLNVTPTVSDTEAVCPIGLTTTLPDPCFVASGDTFGETSGGPVPIIGLIQKVRPMDEDADGIDDRIDEDPATPSVAFDDSSGTHGLITGGTPDWHIYVSDLTGSGVEIISRANAAELVLCDEVGSTALTFGARVEVVCGSVTVKVVEGQVVRDLGNGITLTIPQGSTATTTDEGTVIVDQGTATLEVNGTSTDITPGDGPVPIDGDADADGDGIPDIYDPDELWDELMTIADGSWERKGSPSAVRSILDDVQAAILAEDWDDAHALLAVLLKRSDGGRDDWVAAPAGTQFNEAVQAFGARLPG